MYSGLRLLLLTVCVFYSCSGLAENVYEEGNNPAIPMMQDDDRGIGYPPMPGYRYYDQQSYRERGFLENSIHNNQVRRNTVGPAIGPYGLSRYWYRHPQGRPMTRPKYRMDRRFIPDNTCRRVPPWYRFSRTYDNNRANGK